MNTTTDWSHATPLRRGQAWVQRDGDETAVYNPDTGMLHLLNASALAIWELCDGHTTAAEMAEAVAVVTGLAPDASAADVEVALTSLLAAGLVEA